VLFAYGYFPQDTGYTLLFLGKWWPQIMKCNHTS
jgi:hypothetical protein